jgi:hypothetical protein
MSLRNAPVNANETADSGTSQLPSTTLALNPSNPQVTTQTDAATPKLSTPPVVAARANPQTNSPFFSLPAELRNRIYDYMFAPIDVTLVDGKPLPIDLDTLGIVPASDALLRTCRRAQEEIQGIFDRSPAE